MTNTTEVAAVDADAETATDPGARRTGLTALRLPQLQALAVELGVPGTARMRKSELLDVIRTAQGGSGSPVRPPVADGSDDAPVARTTSTRTTAVRRQRRSPEQAPAPAEAPAAAAAVPADSADEAVAPAPAADRPRQGSRQRSGARTTEQPADRASEQVQQPVEQTAAAREPRRGRQEQRDDRAEQPSLLPDLPESRTEQRTEQRTERGDQRTDRTDQRTERTDRGEQRTERSERPERSEYRLERGDLRGDRQTSSQRDARDRAEEVRLDLDRALAERSERNDRARRERADVRGDARTEARTDVRSDQRPEELLDGRGDDRQGSAPQQRTDRLDRLDRQQSAPQQRTDPASTSTGDDEDDDSGRRGRRGRYRDRDRKGRRGRVEPGTDVEAPLEVSPDDVLLPVAGILDVSESYGFIRTSGYLPGPNDVYVPLAQVKRAGLRPGDAVTGAVRAPRDGEQVPQQHTRSNAQKFNSLVRLDTVNGMTLDEARRRPEFSKLTPLYPNERLRLETDPTITATRIVDLVAPIGKGQRGLIVSPPKAGKTLMMQAIANAISVNNPEVHLMVVLVDERPEEVTDMQRTVKGEVIASTFDRPASDHTAAAELAIERAKRLVELGHDVVVLLDSLTRLGRAYNLAAPASGRILSGGVDAAALYHPKKFFGAARNIENGGSLTIIASALVETGSKADEVIFEEFKGTGNMELRLDRRLADKRVFPAVDVNPSGTRREEILLGRDELAVMWKLRRVLTALDSQQALELLLGKMRETKSNAEFLMQVQSSTPVTSSSRTAPKD